MQKVINKHKAKDIDDLLSNLKEAYKNKNYLLVIKIYNDIKKNKDFQDFYFINLNLLYQIYSFVFAASVLLLDYKSALSQIKEFYEYYMEICRFYKYMLDIRNEEKRNSNYTNNKKSNTTEIIKILKEQFEIFNNGKYIEFYVNLAYANYKNKNYIDSIFYYEIAINKIEKTHKNKINLVELYVGKSQALYYYYGKDLLGSGVIETIQSYINKISMMGNSIDVLLGLAKLNYFIRKTEIAINYIELALEKINDEAISNPDYKIYAYDWLSRITYSSKQYATANKFYSKLISLIIEDKQNVNDKNYKNIIYPKPILADIVKFLNETSNLLAQKEASYVFQSIYIGIFATAVIEIMSISITNGISMDKICHIIYFILPLTMICIFLHFILNNR